MHFEHAPACFAGENLPATHSTHGVPALLSKSDLKREQSAPEEGGGVTFCYSSARNNACCANHEKKEAVEGITALCSTPSLTSLPDSWYMSCFRLS